MGDTFGKLTVINQCESVKNGSIRYLCKCECGKEVKAISTSLNSGRTYSCGCYRKTRKMAHGYCFHREIKAEYTCWLNLKRRCLDPTNKYYHNYGAKGIGISDEWMSFKQFIEDMGPHPFPRATIERKDNSKGYNKDNCRWATYKEQAHNKSNNKIIMFMGIRTIPTDWLPFLPIKRTSLYSRLDAGKTIEEILTEFNLKITIENGTIKKII